VYFDYRYIRISYICTPIVFRALHRLVFLTHRHMSLGSTRALKHVLIKEVVFLIVLDLEKLILSLNLNFVILN